MASATTHTTDSVIDAVANFTAREFLGRDLSDEELQAVRRELNPQLPTGLVEHRAGTKTKLTPPELARLGGISPDKVLTWIRRGELRAINVATGRNGRPRYLIDIADVQAFESRRVIVAPTELKPRRKSNQPGLIEFF